MMRVNVLAFGIAKDIVGGSSVSVETEGSTVDDLKQSLQQQFPSLQQLSSYMIAVNNEYVRSNVTLSEGDEVAIIPPVSGG
jgi:molybdopterin synthase sulfur carrier subunit